MSRGPRIVPHSEAALAGLYKGHKVAQDNFWDKVANLDELMEMGADAREIPERSGWAHRQSMRKGLQRKNLHEIWERYQTYAANN